MKTIPTKLSAALTALAFILGFFLGGCASVGGGPDVGFVQKLIDGAGLDHSFKGTAHLREAVSAPGSVGLDVTVHGLRWDGERWTWKSIDWKRNGVWTNGDFTLTPDAN
jgi:hypothetical protein